MTNTPLPAALEFDRFYAAEQLRRSRHPLRRFVKGFYLRNILRDVAATGQHLKGLPVTQFPRQEISAFEEQDPFPDIASVRASVPPPAPLPMMTAS